jgi:carbonic anhydrase
LVFTEPVEVTGDQIATFQKIVTANARPTQPLDGRTVEEDSSE